AGGCCRRAASRRASGSASRSRPAEGGLAMTGQSWVLGGAAFALSAALTLLPSGSSPAQAPAGEKVALLVGVGRYDHANFDDLKYAERDAEETAKLLRDNGFSRVVVLSGDAEPSRPTLENLRRELAGLLHKRTKRDTVLVALSGHGLQR